MSHILVVDDEAFTRHGLSNYLGALGYGTYEAGDVQTAWELVRRYRPPTAVVDIRLPLTPIDHPHPQQNPNGLQLARELKQTYPTIGLILLSAHEEYEREVIRLSQQFVRGIAFLHKGGDMGQLEPALRAVQAGHTLFQPDMVNAVVLDTAVRQHLLPDETLLIDTALANFPTLTPREAEIAHLLAAAYTSQAIANRLTLAKGTVENYTVSIYEKLGLAHLKQEDVGLRALPILTKVCLLFDICHPEVA
jgi:DNA-binding NarL/FixJ family response regulator